MFSLDELLAVATSVTSQLFAHSPEVESRRMGVFASLTNSKKDEDEEEDEKDVFLAEILVRLKDAPEQCMKKDDLGSDLVKHNRKGSERERENFLF